MNASKRYIPALSFRWLTPLYDPLLKWVMREETFKCQLVQQANIKPDMKVLDLGCGTGTLTLRLKKAHPDAHVMGLDGDPQVLEVARKKSQGMDIQWDEGLAPSLPYPDSVFDRVVTSLVIHHLTTDVKRRAFQEVYRRARHNNEKGDPQVARMFCYKDSTVCLIFVVITIPAINEIRYKAPKT